MKRIEFLVLALIAGIIGFAVARVLRLSEFATVASSAVPAFLVSFPFVKHRNPQATFKAWALAAALSLLFAWLFYVASARLVGS